MDKKILLDLYDTFYEKMIAGDTDSLRAMLTDDFSVRHPAQKSAQNAQDFILSIQRGDLKFYSRENESVLVSLCADSAVITGRSRVDAQLFGGNRRKWRVAIEISTVRSAENWLISHMAIGEYK